MKMQTKAFLLGKDGEDNGRQDALYYNIEKGLFAVADGVSNSFHPEIVAQALCEKFVSMNPEEMKDWKELPQKVLLPEISVFWKSKIEEYMSSLSGRLLRHEQYNYETWKVGASTFCGIYVDESCDLIRFAILGDSTLFTILIDGSSKEFNSSQKRVDEDGNEITDYSNSTDAILSDGNIVGEWLIGEFPLSHVRSMVLMTDGLAKWFQKCETNGQSPDLMLWELQSNDDFKKLAEKARINGDMDDDLAVILIHPSKDNQVIQSDSSSVLRQQISSDFNSELSVQDNNDNTQDLESESQLNDENSENILSHPMGELETTVDLLGEELKSDNLIVTPCEILQQDAPIEMTFDEIVKIDIPDETVSYKDDLENITSSESSQVINDEYKQECTTDSAQISVKDKIDTVDEIKKNDEVGISNENIEKSNREDVTQPHSSFIEKLKATIRIWRNYPTDPIK